MSEPSLAARLLYVLRKEGFGGLLWRLRVRLDRRPIPILPPFPGGLGRRILWVQSKPEDEFGATILDCLMARRCQVTLVSFRKPKGAWPGCELLIGSKWLRALRRGRQNAYQVVVAADTEAAGWLGALGDFPQARRLRLVREGERPPQGEFEIALTPSLSARHGLPGRRVAVLDRPEVRDLRVGCAFGLGMDSRSVPVEWSGAEPLVSICIPTYNGTAFLHEALQSACAQNYPKLEILLSDDGSQDGTLQVAQEVLSQSGRPFRLLNGPQQGMVANWEHLVEQSRGEFIKFLFQDDVLAPDCVRELVLPAQSDAQVGLVFSPRELVLDVHAEKDDLSLGSARHASDVHLTWSDLRAIQSGHTLLADPALFQGCWNKIGEPTTVLLRRSTLQRIGAFDPTMGQVVDLDMWLRFMADSKVAFVERPLSVFRVHLGQVTRQNHLAGLAEEHSLELLKKLARSPILGLLHASSRRVALAGPDWRAAIGQGL